jgi:bacteriocin-like protein
MDTSEEKIRQIKEALDKLQELEIESLSDDDLQTVSGGLCSLWCCSTPESDLGLNA